MTVPLRGIFPEGALHPQSSARGGTGEGIVRRNVVRRFLVAGSFLVMGVLNLFPKDHGYPHRSPAVWVFLSFANSFLT